MRDLREDLDPVWRTTARLSSAVPGGRTLMFVAANSGEGVTSMATSFACMAARRSEKLVWLVDLEFRRNPIFAALRTGFAADIGKPGRAYDASLRQSPIYRLSPPATEARQQKLLTVHEMEGLPLMVTRFRHERLKAEQSMTVADSPGWWTALRGLSSWAVVDAPALDRSSAALTMAPNMDGIILVVSADYTNAAEIDSVRRELEAKNGRILGVVMNRVKSDARFAERFSA